jgi:hypothetical protein
MPSWRVQGSSFRGKRLPHKTLSFRSMGTAPVRAPSLTGLFARRLKLLRHLLKEVKDVVVELVRILQK